MRKTYQELEFKDAFMFAAVMSDAESCRGVLERILVNITGTFTPLVRIEETIVPD